jgi:sec-independent protein translocase protein TatC
MADERPMTLVEHLEELRRRIIISVLAILVATAAAFFLSDAILRVLLLPSGGLQLKAFGLMDGFMIKWRIALYTGIVVAFPIWAYHLLRFVGPGLTEREQRAIFPTLWGALVLFVIGAVFGYYLLWGMIRVLIQLFPHQVEYLPAADDYISFVVFFLLACGLAFQLPIVLLILIQLRILTTDLLRKQRRFSYFALFVFAEIITPVSDPIVAPLTVMLPLVLLYELSIWLGRGVERGLKRSAEKRLAA